MIGIAAGRALLLGTVDSGVYTYVTTGTSIPQPCMNYSKWAVFVQSSGGTVSTGVLTIEEADYDPNLGPAYGGSWSQITTIDLTTLSAAIGQAVYHAPTAAYGWVRARISTSVTGTNGGVIVSFRGRE